MSIEKYRGYVVEGFAKPVEGGMFESLGRVSRDDNVIAESDVLESCARYGDAQARAIQWAQEYVDRLEDPR
ncbi:hypothetical protein [Cupriavidus basilensis]|uniref:hypothetical protein n=1 Tax=Cupriavidus basilensis TaxID=68895 RepID=UPI0039F6AC4B